MLIVTGDHSTPSYLKSHSWHPVPTLLVSDCCRPDGHTTFGENTAVRGGLGQFEAKYLMTLALANAGRLAKYGAPEALYLISRACSQSAQSHSSPRSAKSTIRAMRVAPFRSTETGTGASPPRTTGLS